MRRVMKLYLIIKGLDNFFMWAENAVLDTENNRSPSVVQSMEEVRRLDVASTNTLNVVVKPDGRVIRSILRHFI
jgi:hypothetical protein